MGVVTQQSIKGTIANYLGVAIGFVTIFFVITNYLSQEEVGLTRIMVDAALLFSSIAQLGTNASIIRFFPYFKTDDDQCNHGIFGWAVLLPFVGFLIFVASFLIFKDAIVGAYSKESPLLLDYCYLLIPLTFFALYLTVFETNATVLMHITVPKLVREVGIRVFNLIAYLLYGFHFISLDVFVLLFCGSYALAMVLNLCYLFSLGKISFRIDWHFLNPPLFKDMMRYTLFMTTAGLAANIPLFNSLFLGAKTGLALTGVYTIAFNIANVVEVPYRSLGAIARPLVAQAVKDENWCEVNRLAQRVSLHQFLMALLIFFFIFINLSPLFALIPHGAEYVGGIGVVCILGLSKIVSSSLSVGFDILNYSKKYPLTLFFNLLLAFSALFLNSVLISFWGINGAACSTLFSYLIFYFLLLLYLRITLKVNLFAWGHCKVVGMIAVLLLLNYLWTITLTPLFPSTLIYTLVEAAARSLILLLLAVGAVYALHISDEINNIIQKYYHKCFSRLDV